MTSKEFAQWARDQINFFSKQKEQLDKERKQSEKFFEIRENQLKNVMASQSTLAGKLIGISLKLIGSGRQAHLVYRNDNPKNMTIGKIERYQMKDIKFIHF